MNIEIINTGSELLLGTTLNTHGAWMGMELLGLGLRVQRQTTVPDGEAIITALGEAMERSDAVIITGGLGPTSDDISREAAAEVLGVDLITDEAALRSLEAFFASRGRPMAESNKKQALNPVGADILPNPNGTAPGIYAPPRMSGDRLCALFLLPGPPNELRPMFRAEVLPRLRALAGVSGDYQMQVLRCTGVGESDFHQDLDVQLNAIEGLEIGYCARPAEVDLRLIGKAEAVRKAASIAQAAFPEQCFSACDENLEQVLVRLLSEQGKKLALAESCTGGRIASRVTDVSGASQVFTHGFVTYANEAKVEMLGVPADVIERHGAVSEEVAIAMAEGALKSSGADIAASVTGIAGPTGGTEDKPVGTVWIGIAIAGKSYAVHRCHNRGREVFKQVVSQTVLDFLRRELLANSK
ncbi:competence/damage-inducible protein A [Oceaniferula flava]|uniref:competence/damage-inducible protein A n=1 Tax=Oceaniferula flava TaxID=2800421 RepID=UPI0028682E55|nr:competence/damage-inducible protein A [Oceaniferula flavus]